MQSGQLSSSTFKSGTKLYSRNELFRDSALTTSMRVSRRRQGLTSIVNIQNAKPGVGGIGTIRLKLFKNGEDNGDNVETQKKLSTGTLRLTGTRSMRNRPIQRDPNTIFVAGSTGRLGVRIVKELLSNGLKVIAGARDIENANKDLKMAVDLGIVSSDQLKLLKIVPFDVRDEDLISSAFMNAGQVVFAAAVSFEKKDSTPKEIDGEGAIRVVELAAKAGIERFIMISSLGTGKFGLPAALLNIFGNILTYKRKSEVALENSGMVYTIIRPGGLERPGDDYKEKNNMVLYERDKIFNGLVSRLQVAELVTTCCLQPELAENKCLEVVASDKAPLLSYEDLLEQIPSEISREDQLELKMEREEISEKIVQVENQIGSIEASLADYKEKRKSMEKRLKELVAEAKSVKSEAASALKAAAGAQQEIDNLRETLNEAVKEEAVAKGLLQEAKKAARENRILTDKEREEIVFAILNPEIIQEREEEAARLAKEEAQRQREEAIAKAKAEKEAKAEEARKKAEEEKLAKEKAVPEVKEKKFKVKSDAESATAKNKQDEDIQSEKAKAEEEVKIAAAAQAKKEAEAEAARTKEEERRQEELRIKAAAEARMKAQKEEARIREEERKRLEEEKLRIAAEAAAAAAEEARRKQLAAEEARKIEESALAEKAASSKSTQNTSDISEESTNGWLNPSKWGISLPWGQQPKQQEGVLGKASAKEWIGNLKEQRLGNGTDGPSAREWIENWRESQTESETERPSAKEWIANWRSKQ